jgi:hypothetical protein
LSGFVFVVLPQVRFVGNTGLGNWNWGFIDRDWAKPDSGLAMEERRKNQSGSGERRKADAERIADALNRRGRVAVHVRGTGMLPLVRPGDVALIRRDKLENMRSADVVLMQRRDHLIAKRICEDEDSSGGEISGLGEEMLGASAADRQNSSGHGQESGQQLCNEQQLLGKIVRVRRKKEKNATEAVASGVLRPAR